jgi:hypothetical protein
LGELSAVNLDRFSDRCSTVKVNVFVLCTGRSGSHTFARAAAHISNYSAGHELRAKLIGDARFAYPPNHIEADNRLSWMLGRLEEKFGEDAFYVHLTRNADATARSFNRRWHIGIGIVSAYRKGILMGSKEDPLAICADYVGTVNANIRAFLKDKPLKMDFQLECAHQHWPIFWSRIDAEGDLSSSLREWDFKRDSSAPGAPSR